jgi:hypothetical protein
LERTEVRVNDALPQIFRRALRQAQGRQVTLRIRHVT